MKVVGYVLSILLFACHSFVVEAGCTESTRVKYSYLNGVGNTLYDANLSNERIVKIFGKNDNFLRAQIPTLNDVCVTVLYNLSVNKMVDTVETIAQKLREDTSVPFSWNNVATFIFNQPKLLTVGYTTDKIITILSDLEVANIPYQEEQTMIEITEKARLSLMKYSLVVVSHSQGNLFANIMYQRLLLDSSVSTRINRFANLQIAASGAFIAAPINDYYTNSFDFIINPLRPFFSVLPSNVDIYPLDLNSIFDFTRHGFKETYTSSEARIGFSSTTAEEFFMQKITNIAARVVDHKCNPGEITFPTINPDGIGGGFIGRNANKIGDVYLYDGARLCGQTYVDATQGRIEIRGEASRITNSYLVNSNPESTMLIQNLISNNLSVYETAALYDTELNGVTLENMLVEDAQISFASMSGTTVRNSILSTITLLNSLVTGQTVIDDAYIVASNISGGSQIFKSTILNSTIFNSQISGSLISRSGIRSSSLVNVEARDSEIDNCNFSGRFVSGRVSCN